MASLVLDVGEITASASLGDQQRVVTDALHRGHTRHTAAALANTTTREITASLKADQAFAAAAEAQAAVRATEVVISAIEAGEWESAVQGLWESAAVC